MLLYLPKPQRQKHFPYIIPLLIFITVFTGWGFMGLKNTSRDSDLELSENTYLLTKETSGELHLLTYNIAGLPAWISSAKTARASSISEIGDKINAYDIVNLQEDFNYNKNLNQSNRHTYKTSHQGGVPFGDGLSTFSKYPIVAFERVPWDDCNGADCLTPKGFTYARIQVAKSVYIDVYNIHATAQDDQNATIARQQNLNQFKKYILEKSAAEAVLLFGDFNAHYSYSADNIDTFSADLELLDSWVVLQNQNVVPSCQSQYISKPALQISDKCESIDKILFRNSKHILFTPKTYKVEKELFSNQQKEPLSDHFAISVVMNWKLLKN